MGRKIIRKIIDLTGQKIGDWTILGEVDKNKGVPDSWLCKCVLCGAEGVARGRELRRGSTKSFWAHDLFCCKPG